jgi:hypothetical protein
MADKTSRRPKGSKPQVTTGVPVRLPRGDASPEEVAAILAILATVGGGGDHDPTETHPSSDWRNPQSPWSSPRRMVRTTHPHGPGGWRASTHSR